MFLTVAKIIYVVFERYFTIGKLHFFIIQFYKNSGLIFPQNLRIN